jgi:hypothetical protein
MAKIDIKDQVAYPVDTVYETFRDKLKELLPYLPNISDIVVTKHDRTNEHTVSVVNVWKAKNKDIPSAVQRLVPPEKLQWTDYATWSDDKKSCAWRMEMGFLTDAIQCSGTTTYSGDGDKTAVHIQGEFKLDGSKLPFLVRPLVGTIEEFVVKLIQPNLTEVNRGMEQYLKK